MYVEVIEIIEKQKDHEKAFKRTKEQKREIVNFKDCRPKLANNNKGDKELI